MMNVRPFEYIATVMESRLSIRHQSNGYNSKTQPPIHPEHTQRNEERKAERKKRGKYNKKKYLKKMT